MKLSPLYYAKNVVRMPREYAVLYLAILAAGLVLPYFVWDNYLDIYRYGNELKGDRASTVGALMRAALGHLDLVALQCRVLLVRALALHKELFFQAADVRGVLIGLRLLLLEALLAGV